MRPRSMNIVPSRQSGVVLVVALVLLVAITLLSLAGISTTTLELLMATNQQARTEAFQQAEAGIDSVASNSDDNFMVAGLVGAERCTPGFDETGTDVNCGSPDLIVPSEYDPTYSQAAVRRLPPLRQSAPRFAPSSHESFEFAAFNIDSRYDATDVRGGRAEHNQGLIVSVPKSKQLFDATDKQYDVD